jgi:hypothetical protein
MITKEQAMQLRYGQELHCEVVRSCKRSIGPRGGIHESIVRVRVSGACKTWKRNPEAFRVPVKYGMYESGELTNVNASQFHFQSECPALNTCVNCGHAKHYHRGLDPVQPCPCYAGIGTESKCGCYEFETAETDGAL